jgi:hypothetical protein
MGEAQYVLYLLEIRLGTVAIYYRQKIPRKSFRLHSAEPPSASKHTLNVCQDIYLASFSEKVGRKRDNQNLAERLRETSSWQTITWPQTEQVCLAIAPSGRTTFNSLRSPSRNTRKVWIQCYYAINNSSSPLQQVITRSAAHP